MQVTGMLYGAKLLQFAGFPTSEVLGSDASEEEIKALIERHGSVFIKPVFKGGVGKKGKAGLLGRATALKTALKEKKRLYLVEHRHTAAIRQANGVTFEGAVPAEFEVYFSITIPPFRAPAMTLLITAAWISKSSRRARWPASRSIRSLNASIRVANALSALDAPHSHRHRAAVAETVELTTTSG
jgi:hypothetical protein